MVMLNVCYDDNFLKNQWFDSYSHSIFIRFCLNDFFQDYFVASYLFIFFLCYSYALLYEFHLLLAVIAIVRAMDYWAHANVLW